VLSDVPSIDEFDETCRIHDAAYASGSDLLSADVAFTRANFGKGAKRTAAAAAVGVQAAVRAIDKFIPKIYPNKTKMTKNGALRGAKAQMSKKAPKNQSTPKQSTLSTVPAAYGYTLRMQAPSIVRRGNMAVITVAITVAQFRCPTAITTSLLRVCSLILHTSRMPCWLRKLVASKSSG